MQVEIKNKPTVKLTETPRKKRLAAVLSIVGVIVVAAVTLLFVFSKPKPVADSASEPSIETFIYGNRTIPVAPGVAQNPYNPDLFELQNGYMTYNEPGMKTFTGIDVSSHQEQIDWVAVKNAGIDFAMLRAGFRGATEGKLYIDNRFIYNINSAEAAGIDIGIYLFSQAITPEEAVEEAEIVLKWIKGYNVSYPIVFDWEHQRNIENARTNHLSGEDLSACALAFCNTIYQAGYIPMIYFYQDLAYMYYDLDSISAYDFWIAEPDSGAPTFFYDFQMFQYSHKGSVPGISGAVDLNLCFVDYTTKRADV